MTYGDFETWLLNKSDTVFRYWIYKRMFTPEEVEKKWSDQSQYEIDTCICCKIVECVPLEGGDYLLGLQDIDDEDSDTKFTEYYRLSDIHLEWCSTDNEKCEYCGDNGQRYECPKCHRMCCSGCMCDDMSMCRICWETDIS